MEFDPNSNPPCYKTVDEVRIFNVLSYYQPKDKKKKYDVIHSVCKVVRMLLTALLLLSFTVAKC